MRDNSQNSSLRFIYLILGCFCFANLQALNQREYVEAYQLNRPASWNLQNVPSQNIEKGEIKIAFWNIQVQWVTDLPTNLKKYPQYEWKKRLKTVVELIKKDSPDVLGLCECTLTQAKDLKAHFEKEGYFLFGYSSETLHSIEELDAIIEQGGRTPYYGELVGFLYKSKRVQFIKSSCYPLEKGEKHKRILVVGHFLDKLTKREFSVLASHFDHLSEHSREKSAQQELALIEELEKSKTPWFSVSDRNWYPDGSGQKSAEKYLKPYVVDFRDETVRGHFRPSGTFAGHLGLESNRDRKVLQLENGMQMIQASSVDVHFRSRKLIKGICSYAYTAEFDPETYDLLPVNSHGDLKSRNFASDHYYTGGTFRFRRLKKVSNP
jgi:hypothetical protein